MPGFVFIGVVTLFVGAVGWLAVELAVEQPGQQSSQERVAGRSPLALPRPGPQPGWRGSRPPQEPGVAAHRAAPLDAGRVVARQRAGM